MMHFIIECLLFLLTSTFVLSFWCAPPVPSPPASILRRQKASWPRKRASLEIKNDSTVASFDSIAAFDSESYREIAFRVAENFLPREFRPASPLLANKHVQTISGALLRTVDSCRYVTIDPDQEEFDNLGFGLQLLASTMTPSNPEESDITIFKFWDKRERIDTPDGDFFHVDSKFLHGNEDKASSKGLVIIVHGLESNSNSTLVVDMATAFGHKGFDVSCINFRGCSGEPNNGLKAYHLGFTTDLKHYVSLLKHRTGSNKPSAIFIAGKSLGANVVLKALGELGVSAITEYNIQGAAVNCVPFDNMRNKDFFLRGFSKVIYNNRLLQSLQATAFKQLDRFAETEEAKNVNLDKLAKATTITEFDDAYIAPLFGFQGFQDYYNKTSCLNFLNKIRVPTLILNSADDPFMDPTFFPWDYGCDSEAGKQSRSPIKMVRSTYGGHLGYMFHAIERADSPPGSGSHGDANKKRSFSFMPSELARFLDSCSL